MPAKGFVRRLEANGNITASPWRWKADPGSQKCFPLSSPFCFDTHLARPFSWVFRSDSAAKLVINTASTRVDAVRHLNSCNLDWQYSRNVSNSKAPLKVYQQQKLHH